MPEFDTQIFNESTEQTRLCLDPWSLALIKANGDVWPCCNSQSVGSILTTDLESIIDNEQFTAYRKGLYTGELTESCQNCPARRSCTLEELHAALDKYQKTGVKVL